MNELMPTCGKEGQAGRRGCAHSSLATPPWQWRLAPPPAWRPQAQTSSEGLHPDCTSLRWRWPHAGALMLPNPCANQTRSCHISKWAGQPAG